MMNKDNILWILIRIALIILSALIFTPLVTPKGVFTPLLFDIPYTLWMGIFIYFCFVILIFWGIRVHARLFTEQNHD